MKSAFRGNDKTTVFPSGIDYYKNKNTRSRNMEASFRGNILTLVHSSSNGYYMY